METLRKRLIGFALLSGLCLLGAPGYSEARETSVGYSTTESSHTVFQHSEYEFYFNNSGAVMPSGTVVVQDRTGTGVNVGISGSLTTVPRGAARANVDTDSSDGDVTNVGTYITTTTSNDSAEVVGVVDDDSCADQTYCRVQIYGPRLVRCAQSSDAVTTGSAVGSANGVSGRMGGGNGLGVALSACTATSDNAIGWVFIRPGGND